MTVLSAIASSVPAAADEGHETSAVGFEIETWEVPKSCGDQAHFESLVHAAIGAWPDNLPVVHIDIEVTRADRTFVLIMQTRAASGEGRRELRARTCEELLATGAVVLSLALDSEALMSNEREHEVQTTQQVREPSTATAKATKMKRPPRHVLDDEDPVFRRPEGERAERSVGKREALNTGVRLLSVAEYGTLPRAALGLGFIARAHTAGYSVSFRLVRWAEQVQFLGTTDMRGGSFDLLSGSLLVCREVHHGPALAGLCALGSIARVSATGIAYSPESAVNLLVSPGIGAFHDLLVGPTRFRVHAEGAIQLSRPRYLLNQGMSSESQIHQPAYLSIRAGLSWGMSF